MRSRFQSESEKLVLIWNCHSSRNFKRFEKITLKLVDKKFCSHEVLQSKAFQSKSKLCGRKTVSTYSEEFLNAERGQETIELSRSLVQLCLIEFKIFSSRSSRKLVSFNLSSILSFAWPQSQLSEPQTSLIFEILEAEQWLLCIIFFAGQMIV